MRRAGKRDGSREIRMDGLDQRTHTYEPTGAKSNTTQVLRRSREAELRCPDPAAGRWSG